jgi:hypothetical protein
VGTKRERNTIQIAEITYFRAVRRFTRINKMKKEKFQK